MGGAVRGGGNAPSRSGRGGGRDGAAGRGSAAGGRGDAIWLSRGVPRSCQIQLDPRQVDWGTKKKRKPKEERPEGHPNTPASLRPPSPPPPPPPHACHGRERGRNGRRACDPSPPRRDSTPRTAPLRAPRRRSARTYWGRRCADDPPSPTTHPPQPSLIVSWRFGPAPPSRGPPQQTPPR